MPLLSRRLFWVCLPPRSLERWSGMTAAMDLLCHYVRPLIINDDRCSCNSCCAAKSPRRRYCGRPTFSRCPAVTDHPMVAAPVIARHAQRQSCEGRRRGCDSRAGFKRIAARRPGSDRQRTKSAACARRPNGCATAGASTAFSSSVVGLHRPTYGVCAATNAGVEAMTHILAKEPGSRSIT